jgi:D-inositol-3-phosphate glycosyltransferase
VPDVISPIYRRLVHSADLIICCSGFVRDQLAARLGRAGERALVVHGGIELDAYADASPAERAATRQALGVEPGEVALLFAGAIVPEKGLAELLAGLHQVRSLFPEQRWRLLVAGDADLWRTIEGATRPGPDPYTRRCHQLAEGLPVTWLGVVSHDAMPGLYGAVDIVLCPSTWDDPFPTVNLEAMAAGRPIIASRVGGVPEAVLDGETGILVPRGDPDALRAALAQLIAEPATRQRLGLAGCQRAQGFTSAAVAQRLDALYGEILA